MTLASNAYIIARNWRILTRRTSHQLLQIRLIWLIELKWEQSHKIERGRYMSEEHNQGGGMMQNIMIGILGVLTLVGLFLISQVNSRLNTLEGKVSSAEAKLEKKISATEDEAANAKEKNEQLAQQ